MRITAGIYGGRQYIAPNTVKTHPMSDKMKGAIFNALGDLSDLKVLDAFAGSGGLGYEALSRGADYVVLVDYDRQAQKCIVTNIDSLKIGDKAKVISADIGSWLKTSSEQFDVILADPPYDSIKLNLISALAERLNPGGIFVLSYPGKQTPPTIDNFKIISNKNYRDSQLIFYINKVNVN